MKLKTPTRPNFSRSAKLCDQNLYHDSYPNFQEPQGYQSPKRKQKSPQNKNFFFRSVSRQKRGNFRFNVIQGKGQFIYYPDFNCTKSRSPRWVIPKSQKYQNQKYQQYQLCQKHPLFKQNTKTQMKAAQSMKQFFKNKVKMSKSNSMMSTSINFSKNYSILSPRDTSPSGFFNQTKVKNPRYLTKKDLCQIQSQEDQKRYTQRLLNSQRGFIDFKRQKQRKPNVVRKSFEYFVKNYEHQKQFSNFQMTQHPTHPQYHIDFNKHLDRPDFYNPQKIGPNSQVIDIDFTRKKENNINYKLSTFRDKVRTRYDRAEPQPNTRIDITLPQQKPKGMVSMQKVIARNKQLFPVIDPIIKKSGDKEMKDELKKQIFKFQINQALKPINPQIQIKTFLK